MKKLYIYILTTIIVCLLKLNNVNGQIIDYYDISPELSEIEGILEENKNTYTNVLETTPKELIKDLLSGNFKFNLSNFINKIVRLLFREVIYNKNILVNLMMLAIFFAILKNMGSSFLNESISHIALYSCHIAMVSILIMCFNNCINIVKDLVNDVRVFSYSILPISTNLMITSGQITKGSVLRPFILYELSMVVGLIKKVILPLIYYGTILGILNNITDSIEVSRFGKLLKNIAKIISGFVLTIFIGVITIKGSMANCVDELTGKTAKYMFGTFIPVVGKYLADAAESVIGSLMLIKNVTGIASIIGILIICIMPILKLLSVVIILNILEVVLEPVTDKRLVNSVGEVSKSINGMIGIVFLLAFVVIISFTVLIINYR